MSDYEKEYKALLKRVDDLEDTIIKLKRNLKDELENLDIDNFSESLKVKQDNASLEIKQTAKELSVKMEAYDTSMVKMQSEIKQTAEAIETKVSKENLKDSLKEYSTTLQTASLIQSTVTKEYVIDLVGDEYATVSSVSEISQKADDISISVTETQGNLSTLEGKINVQSDEITAIISGEYTKNLLDDYLTGIEITPNNIKMIDGNAYSVYNKSGLRFYDSSGDVEGWAIEPAATNFGGTLKYYVNGKACYEFGETTVGYSTDITLKALGNERGRFVVDVTESGNKEVMFIGLNNYNSDANSPVIYANEKLLATQDWVLANASGGGTGTVVAVFG